MADTKPDLEAVGTLQTALRQQIAACQAALDWYGLDGDHISDPVRQQLLKAIRDGSALLPALEPVKQFAGRTDELTSGALSTPSGEAVGVGTASGNVCLTPNTVSAPGVVIPCRWRFKESGIDRWCVACLRVEVKRLWEASGLLPALEPTP